MFIKPKTSLMSKVVSLILVFAFSFYNVGYAAETQMQPPAGPEVRTPLSTEDIGIAIDAATVKSRHQGGSGKMVVHIQDAHCNYEAQTNINKVLDQLTKECGIDMISVEGAEGLVDTAWFRAFPDAEIRKEVATYFMKKGEITGAEFFSITSDFEGSIFGAETREYYIKNLRAFTDVYPYKTMIEQYFTDLRSVCNRLKSVVYSPKLRELDSKVRAFDAKELDLSDFAEYLAKSAAKNKVDVKQYPNFKKLLDTLEYEEKIDFDIVDQERSEYIDLLSKKLSKEDMTELVTQSIRFKKGHIKAVDFYGYLRELAKIHDIKIVQEYPNLFYYYLYTKLYDGIDNEKLFKELDAIERALKDKLFKSDTERTLDKYSHMVDMYVDLVNIELTNEDYDLFKQYSKEFSMDDVLNFISNLVAKYNLVYTVGDMPLEIQQNMPRMVNFYEVAIQRDNALINNTLKQMDEEGTDRCVLIAGGFHTRGIKNILEAKGVSYVVVTPKITKDVETPYIKVLTNQRTSLEDIITESAAVPSVGVTASREDIVRPKGDMLSAPARVFWTIPLSLGDTAELQAISDAVGVTPGGRSIAEAARDTYTDIVRANVRAWVMKQKERVTPEVWELAVNDWQLLMGAYLKKFEESAAAENFTLAEGFRGPEEGVHMTDEEIDAIDAQFREIFQGVVTEATSPGQQAIAADEMTIEQDDIGTPLTENQARIVNDILREIIQYGDYEVREIDGANVYLINGLEEAIAIYNSSVAVEDQIPGNIVHPGRGLWHTDENIYLSAKLFEEGPNALTDAEIGALVAHELSHIRSPKKAEETIIGELHQEEEIASIRMKLLNLAKDAQAKAEAIERMRAWLWDDRKFGEGAWEHLAWLEDVVDRAAYTREKIAAQKAMNDWVVKAYTIRQNIDRMRNVLTAPKYEGYDVILASNSTDSESEYQQGMGEKLFEGLRTDNDAMGKKVCFLSIPDKTEGGQIIGQANTWRIAVERFRKWAEANDLPETDLDKLFKEGKVKVAVYHNGGKGERASPGPLDDNSRGKQDIVGEIMNANGEMVDLNLMGAIYLNTAPMAITNDSSRIDTFWGNQITVGTVDSRELNRTNHQFDKFVIKVPEKPRNKDLFDYGTAVISETGQPTVFLANKSLAMKDDNGDWVINPAFEKEYRTLMDAPKGALDVGSFSMSRDMHYALIDYWTNVKKIFERIDASENGRADISRDIDPSLVQILVPLANGLAGKELPADLPTADDLRALSDEAARNAVAAQAYESLKGVMDNEEFVAALDKVYNDPKKRDFVLESIEFFILYRDLLFSDLNKVVGNIDLGEDSHWFAYKRMLDLGNEKFIMLADLIGEKQELLPSGEILRTPLDRNALDVMKAEDARRMRGITADSVCRFIVNGKVVTLSIDQVREGWEDKENKIYVKGSIIQGKTVLLPGSRVLNSVVNDSQGLIIAENSYVESSTGTRINARNSVVFIVTDQNTITGEGEIITDAYRPEIRDERFPAGQTRIRAPIGYDPKNQQPNEKGEVENDKNVFGKNKYAPQIIREMAVDTKANAAIRNANRAAVRQEVPGLADNLRMLALSEPLGVTAKQYAAWIGISEEDAQAEIDDMMEKDLVMATRRMMFNLNEGDYLQMAPVVYKLVPGVDRKEVLEEIKPLKFGTSGLRDEVEKMTDMEVFINAAGYIQFLHEQDLLDKVDVNTLSIVMDRRPSSPRMMTAVAYALEQYAAKLGYDLTLDLGGRAPSPAGAFRGQTQNSFAIIVTGSHIPFDMNGIKFYLKGGEEVLKAHEKPILDSVKKVRAAEYAKTWQEALFDDLGMFKVVPEEYDLYAVEADVNRDYEARNINAYPKDLLQEDVIVQIQLSAVGRDGLVRILSALGGEVIEEMRLEEFFPVDTENVTDDMDALFRKIAARYADRNITSIVFTDGDSDRPGLVDEKGNFLPGDKLGLLVAKDLMNNIPEDAKVVVAVPVSTNYGVIQELENMPNVQVVKTSIGSPHIVKAMNDAAALAAQNGETVYTMGWEANGGFLLGSTINLGEEGDLTRLASRDAVVPLLSAHRLRKRLGVPMSELFVRETPPVGNKTGGFNGLLADKAAGGFGLDRETAMAVRAKIVEALSPTLQDKLAVQIDFDTMTISRRKVAKINGEDVVLFETETVPITEGDPDFAEWSRVKGLLEDVFSAERGFAPIRSINILDGVQSIFENDEISHLRPSGNDPVFRNYAMSHIDNGVDRAKEIADLGETVIIPELARNALAELQGTPKQEVREEITLPEIKEELWKVQVEQGEAVPSTEVPVSELGVIYADFGDVKAPIDEGYIIDALARPEPLKDRDHIIGVTKGSVTVERDGETVAKLKEGDKFPVPADFDEYTLVKDGNGNAVVRFHYQPTSAEKAVYSTYDVVRKHYETISKLDQIDILMPGEMFVPGGKGTVGSAAWEQEQLRKFFGSSNIRIVEYSARMGLSDAARKSVTPGANTRAVLVATKSNIEDADRNDEQIQKMLKGDAKEGVNGVRVLAIPDIDKEEELENRGWYFTREVEGTSLILAALTKADIDSTEESVADDLQGLLSQLTGQSVQKQYLNYLLPYNEQSDDIRNMLPAQFREDPFGWMLFIVQRMLLKMPIKPFDAQEQLEQRRKVMWSV